MNQAEDVQNRIEKVRNLLYEKGLDGVLLRKRRSFSWVTSGQVNHIVNTTEFGVADLLIFQDEAYCVTSKMESARIGEEELDGLGFTLVTPEWYEGHGAAIESLCKGKKIGVDAGADIAGLPNAIDISNELFELSYTLTPLEIERYRWLSQKAAKSLEDTCKEIKPGMSEYEIQTVLASKVLPEGINPQVILVATDERIFRYRHPIATDKKLETYAMIVICAEKWGLVTNLTRFVHFGPLPKQIAENRDKLVEIDLAMNLKTRPGVPIRDVFNEGIQTYAKVGYGEDWRYLHQGGPTGYASREFLANTESPGCVQLHQAFAWNPAIRGIKSEDTILVGESQNEFLTHTGEWVYLQIEVDGKSYLRPDILVRELEN